MNLILLLRDIVKSIYLCINQLSARLYYVKRSYPSSIAPSARLDTYKKNGQGFNFILGKKCLVERSCVINSWIGEVVINDNAIVGINSIVIGPVTIEENVQISQNCFITGENRTKSSSGELSSDTYDVRPINIQKNVWIGSNSSILPGVTIGENSIIGAGSVVTKNIPPNVVAVGVPAKVIKEI